MLPTARRYGMGVLTWSPLAFGFLTGDGSWAPSSLTDVAMRRRPIGERAAAE